MSKYFAVMLGLAAALTDALAEEPPSLADLSFLEGSWRGGDDDFAFEEIWTAPAAGVITGMARGYAGSELRVLEYIVVAENDDGVVMRFKHYNADFWTREENGPVTLQLTAVSENDVMFTAEPPSETVKSIRYWTPAEDTLQADVVLVENGEQGGFSLTFARVMR